MANIKDRYALVDKNGEVKSVIIWNGNEYLPPKDHSMVYGPAADIGDSYDMQSGVFSKPDRTSPAPVIEEPQAEPTVESLAAELAALKQHLNV